MLRPLPEQIVSSLIDLGAVSGVFLLSVGHATMEAARCV
jgi:hypothetical protein